MGRQKGTNNLPLYVDSQKTFYLDYKQENTIPGGEFLMKKEFGNHFLVFVGTD